MQLRYYMLDVFTEQAFTGNPLAVVLDADVLNTAQMQQIAREFNLSETVFIQTPTIENALSRLRIFTPAREMAFAGHPTIGSACLLSELGFAPQGEDERFVLEEGIGPVPVRVRRALGRPAYAELTAAQLPEFAPAPPDAVLAQILGLSVEDLGSNDERPRAVSCGLPFVLVPVRAPEVLAAIDLDVTAWRNALAGQWAQELYVYARGYEGELRARMFAPALGVAEDPATGSAAAALAGALATDSPIVEGRLQWMIHQGLEMGRPSQLHVAAERAGSVVTAVRVGGFAVRVADGLLTV
ncbi:PhzF family phenazine biosynthesis protein [Sinimarinibacterium sp. CAU 1509]|uniref:PhzF family phenazine biosynthesis protein n=1 Tax=Sinimarinibacterium sp. CAU 1509 TaxID=2562283 RepID=UPI0010AD5581|nr:PhzF family phenazine biosynthesis protein [Sinimarinibacterium sp. CAU 1509]TJY58198.1 PhzF family phenazine biosynthesis protein [Sinimarinibacterium sp. CAU 1509]